MGHFAILLFLLVSGGNLGGGFGGRRVILAGQVLIGNGTIAHIVMLFKRITCGGDDWLVECEGGCNIIIYYITKRKKKLLVGVFLFLKNWTQTRFKLIELKGILTKFAHNVHSLLL